MGDAGESIPGRGKCVSQGRRPHEGLRVAQGTGRGRVEKTGEDLVGCSDTSSVCCHLLGCVQRN